MVRELDRWPKFRVRATGRTWGVFQDGELIEGGFFAKGAAEDARDEWDLQIRKQEDFQS